jgi:hypothetical protein
MMNDLDGNEAEEGSDVQVSLDIQEMSSSSDSGLDELSS